MNLLTYETFMGGVMHEHKEIPHAHHNNVCGHFGVTFTYILCHIDIG
jgi:hypothetical protein